MHHTRTYDTWDKNDAVNKQTVRANQGCGVEGSDVGEDGDDTEKLPGGPVASDNGAVPGEEAVG